MDLSPLMHMFFQGKQGMIITYNDEDDSCFHSKTEPAMKKRLQTLRNPFD